MPEPRDGHYGQMPHYCPGEEEWTSLVLNDALLNGTCKQLMRSTQLDWSRWGNLYRSQFCFNPVKFVNLVVPSPYDTQPFNKHSSWQHQSERRAQTIL